MLPHGRHAMLGAHEGLALACGGDDGGAAETDATETDGPWQDQIPAARPYPA